MSDLRVMQLPPHETRYDAAIVRLIDDYAQIPLIHGKPLPPEVLSRMLPGLREHGGLIFVALEGPTEQATPIGVATALPGYSTFYARPLLNVHDLVVAAHWQGRGVGSRLLQAIEDEARRRGCCKVTLEVLAENERAHALYCRLGFDRQADGSELGQSYFLQKPLVALGP